jgi:hypothetical protein
MTSSSGAEKKNYTFLAGSLRMLFNIAIGFPRPPSDGTPDPTRNLNKDVLHKSLKELLQANSLTARLTRK